MIVATKQIEGFTIEVIQDDSSVSVRQIQGVKAGGNGNPSCYTGEKRQRCFYAEIRKDGERYGNVFAAYPRSRRVLAKTIYFGSAKAAITKIESVLNSGDFRRQDGRFYAI
jgi:hypothetical protein